jgi:hypothetical protein
VKRKEGIFGPSVDPQLILLQNELENHRLNKEAYSSRHTPLHNFMYHEFSFDFTKTHPLSHRPRLRGFSLDRNNLKLFLE